MAAIHLLDFYFAGWVQLAFRKKTHEKGIVGVWWWCGRFARYRHSSSHDRVRYGVLTLIGSCILIWILLDKVLKKIPAGVGVSVSFVLFLILRSWTKQDPIQLSDNLLNVTWLKSVLAYIGFPQAGFSSTDYFPLLPWIFLFATGYFLYSFLQEKGLINRLFGKWKVPGINFLGKHSLIIYMIHQPICYVVAFLVSEIF